jgi:hypothetical protein
MHASNEHDDDLEPEVIEGAEIETEKYDEAEDDEGAAPVPVDSQEEEVSEDEAGDTL